MVGQFPLFGQIFIPEIRAAFTESTSGATAMVGSLPAGVQVATADGRRVPADFGTVSITGQVNPATGFATGLKLASTGFVVPIAGMTLATGALQYEIAVAGRSPDGVTEANRFAVNGVALRDAAGKVAARVGNLSLRTERDYADAETARAGRFDRVSGKEADTPASRSELSAEAFRLGMEEGAAPLAFAALKLDDRVNPDEEGVTIGGKLAVTGLRMAVGGPKLELGSGTLQYTLNEVNKPLLEALALRMQTDLLRGVKSRPKVEAIASLFPSGSADLDLKDLKTDGSVRELGGARFRLDLGKVTPDSVSGRIVGGLRGLKAGQDTSLAALRDGDFDIELNDVPPRLYNATASEATFLEAAMPILGAAGSSVRINSYTLRADGYGLSGSGSVAADPSAVTGMNGRLAVRVSDFDKFAASRIRQARTEEDKRVMASSLNDLKNMAKTSSGKGKTAEFEIGFRDETILVNGRPF